MIPALKRCNVTLLTVDQIKTMILILETGDAFVGDLAMNGLPFGLSPGLPVFAEDTKKVKESCKLLLDRGAKAFYPGHGKPFSANLLRRALG